MSFIQSIILLVAVATTSQNAGASPPVDCSEWHQCRQLALEAFERRDYERFHDLAWRTIQTGPRRDPDLMYLLARAQSLSGRLDDALVMLRRLAEMGVPSDAATSDEFRDVRGLPGWPGIEALTARIGAPARQAAPLPTPSTSPATAPPAANREESAAAGGSSPSTPSATPEDVLTLPGRILNSTGLAYDDVSSRFVVGERGARKLLVVDERSQHVLNLVDSSSAGFYEITAFEIDSRRGDLWVVSADGGDAQGGKEQATALHKLQLVSGRPLERLPLPDQFLPARFADVTVTDKGTVFVLDTVGRRVFRIGAGQRTFEVAATLGLDSPVSIGPVSDGVIYVAHAKGIARVELGSGKASPVGGPKNFPLVGFDRLRWDQNTLVGIQSENGHRRAVRIRLAATGRRAQTVELLEADLAMPDPTAATLSGDTFYFLTEQPQGDGTRGGVTFRRVRLR